MRQTKYPLFKGGKNKEAKTRFSNLKTKTRMNFNKMMILMPIENDFVI